MFSVTEYYIYKPADESRSYSIIKSTVPSRMIQQIIKAIDVNQSIPKMNIFDAMKMLTVS